MLFLVLVLGSSQGSWLLAPGFFFSPRRPPSTHSTSSCATRHDTTRQDTVKASSSRLLPCCTPFPSSPPLLSFVLLSLFLVFFLCLSPVQPPPGPILFLETRVVESSRSSSPPLARLLLATPSRHHDCEPPRHHQQQQQHHQPTIHPNTACYTHGPAPSRIQSSTIRSGGNFLFVCVLFVCVLLQSISCIAFTPPVASPSRPSAWLVCALPRIFSNQSVHPTSIFPLNARADLPPQPIPPSATFYLVLGPCQAHDASDPTEAPHVLALASHHRVHAWTLDPTFNCPVLPV